MTLRKPKEKKSRLKDLKDLLETLPGIPKEESKKEIPDSLREWLKKNRPKIKPKKEIPDWFKEFLEKNRPDLWKTKPVPLPEMLPDPDRIKPVPLPEMLPDPDRIKPVPLPEIDPRFLWPPEGWKEDPRYKPSPMPTWPPEGWKKDPRYKRPSPMPDEFLWPPREPQPFKPPRFDPKRGIDPRYLLKSSAPHPTEGWWDMYDDMINSGELDSGTSFEDFMEIIVPQMDIDIPSAAKGGIMDINRMTAPLGYAAGGPAPKESGGLQPPTGLSKWYSDKFPVDPIHQLKENIIDKGKRAAKSIGRSISGLSDIGQELLGAGPAEATVSGMNPLVEFQEMYDQYIIDGGELSFRDFFDMIQSELDKMAGE